MMAASFPLYLALAFYLAGTLTVLGSLTLAAPRFQRLALAFMALGFVAHTVWIGVICTKTGHPPLTNLPESVSFIAWTILAVKLALWMRYRVDAAAFFLYPLVFLLLGLSAVVQERFTPLDPELRSNIFIAHLLLTSLGVAALLVATGFTILYQIQERAIRQKTRGALWAWIPSLKACDVVSFRSLTIGFSIYTLGILAGILWSYRTSLELRTPGIKEAGAFVAWVLFAVLLQSYLSGNYRTPRNLGIAAAAFVAIIVSLLGIEHV